MTPDIAMFDYHQGQAIVPNDAYQAGTVSGAETLQQIRDLTKKVGDINSTAKGSGTRYNNGKAPLELIPIRVITDHWYRTNQGQPPKKEVLALESLALFQEGDGNDSFGQGRYHLLDVLTHLDLKWEDCAAVFDYGRKKYAEWNWAKGMSWSIPIACAARHILLGLMREEENDPESGLPHKGHVACNIVMLLTYLRTFPEGDDRPKGLI